MSGIKPHPNTPRKLRNVFQECDCKYNRVAQRLGVNPTHIWNLIRLGKEPKREDLRHKLFLRVKKSSEEIEAERQTRKQKEEKINQEILQYFEKVIGKQNSINS